MEEWKVDGQQYQRNAGQQRKKYSQSLLKLEIAV